MVFIGTEPSFAIGQNRESIPQDRCLFLGGQRTQRRSQPVSDQAGCGESRTILYCQRLLQELATLMS